MLIHITPKMISPNPICNPHLIDIEIQELGLKLIGGKDIATRRPYPNKQYYVACCKKGKKAVSGILVESPIFLKEYTVTSRWDWTGKDTLVVTHIVKYIVLDRNFDMVSDDMLLWYGSSESNWESRWPEWADGLAPVDVMPCMEVNPSRERQGEYEDEYNSVSGGIIKRTEMFRLPTIERERILNESLYPLPGFDIIFKIGMTP